MTVAEILDQAKTLSAQERDELVVQLQAMQEFPVQQHQPKTGAEIVAMLQAMAEPIELVDSHIEDPVD